MTNPGPPVFAQTCILAAIALACLVGAALYRERDEAEMASVLVFIGSLACLLVHRDNWGDRASTPTLGYPAVAKPSWR